MKKLFILVPLLLASLIVTASSQDEWGKVTDPNKTGAFSEQFRSGMKTGDLNRVRYTNDAVPRFVIRFDDGRADQYRYVKSAVLKYGLPVALNINIGTLGGANKLTVTQVNELLSIRGANGARVYLMHHSNDNLNDTDGYPAGSEGNASMTEAVMEAELTILDYVTTFGQAPKVFMIPGDSGRQLWAETNYPRFIRLLQENGIKYAMFNLVGSDDGNPAPPHIMTHGTTIPVNEISYNERGPDYWLKPGMGVWPYYIPTQSFDLGNYVVERPSGAQWATAISSGHVPRVPGIPLPTTLPDSNYADGWTFEKFGKDAVNTANAWHKTFRGQLYRALGGNYGFCITLHDESDSWNSANHAVSLTEVQQRGYIHFDTIFYLLARLQHEGHLKVVGPEEWCEWVTSEWAPGTDLIANPTMAIPQVDIGDTISNINEYFWPRGVSSWAAARTLPLDGNILLSNNITEPAGGGGAWEYTRGGNTRTGFLKRFPLYGETTVSPEAPAGGIWLHDNTDTSYERLKLNFGGLPPGRYMLNFMADISDPGILYSDATVIQGALLMQDLLDHSDATDAGWFAFDDTVITVYNSEGIDPGSPGATIANWGTNPEQYPQLVGLHFYLPDDLFPYEDFTNSPSHFVVGPPSYNVLREINHIDAGAQDSTLITHPQLIYMGR